MTDLYRLQGVFRDILEDPTLQVTEELSTANCPAWDSVATVQIILATEDEFGVRFTTDEVAHVKSAGDILRLLKVHGR